MLFEGVVQTDGSCAALLRSEQRIFEQAQQELDSALGWAWPVLDERGNTRTAASDAAAIARQRPPPLAMLRVPAPSAVLGAPGSRREVAGSGDAADRPELNRARQVRVGHRLRLEPQGVHARVNTRKSLDVSVFKSAKSS